MKLLFVSVEFCGDHRTVTEEVNLSTLCVRDNTGFKTMVSVWLITDRTEDQSKLSVRLFARICTYIHYLKMMLLINVTGDIVATVQLPV